MAELEGVVVLVEFLDVAGIRSVQSKAEMILVACEVAVVCTHPAHKVLFFPEKLKLRERKSKEKRKHSSEVRWTNRHSNLALSTFNVRFWSPQKL